MNKELRANTSLSHYRIVSKIGAGGMGEVYLAQDTKLDRKVALKILPADLASNRDRMERFVREAKSAAALNHPNIAHVYEIGESNGTHFIAMEFIDGETLREKIHKNKAPLSKLLKYLNQVAEGLSKAHAAGIVHRDLKPDNIMITRDDYAKVLDFGLAKLVEPQRTFGSNESGPSEIATAVMQQPGPPAEQPGWGDQHSTPGMVMGTIGYMSPEQASGRVNEIDHRSDIFSVGCILFEAATGQRAFEGKDVLDSLHKIVHAPTPRLKDVNPLAPDDLQRVVRRCLAKEPEKRYQSIKELAIELDDLQQELKNHAGLEYASQAAVSIGGTTSGTTRADEGFWVAVLPFKYTGGSADLIALAEGLSEEIVTGLSRFSYLRVIARGSTLRYANEAVDVRTVGKEIGARYVMEGSLRQAGSVLRVSVQLVDASTGAHLWAETYDRPFRAEDIFALQDDLVPRIVSTVADWYGVLPHSMSEALRSKGPEELSPYEAVLRSFGYYERITVEEHAAVRAGLERAVKQAPGNADGWAMLSMIYGEEHRFGFNAQPDPLGRALQAARRAADAAPSNHFAHLALAQALYFRKEFQAFRSAAERAIALNPMDASTLAYMGHLMAFSGDWEHGCHLTERAMQLNPHHPEWYWFVFFLDAYHRKSDYRSALASALKHNIPGVSLYHVAVAASSGQLGERQGARSAVRELLVLAPDYASIGRDELGKWYQPELVEHLIDGLRKAGLAIADEGRHGIERERGGDEGSEGEGETTPKFVGHPASIAVLPFVNISNDTDNEYFCDGLAEELLNALSKIEALQVAARTSAFSFKGKETDIREIGQRLNVGAVLEGSVRKAGNRLRIAAQLVNVADGYHLWSESYDRQMEDIFDIQGEISLAIVDALKVKLLGAEKAAVLKRHTDNTEAYQLYLKGRFFVNQRTSESLRKAIECFNQAISVDANYALGYAGLADAYLVLGVPDAVTEALSPQDSLPKARAAAEKALQIDNSVAEIYPSLAHVKWKERDWAGAACDYDRGLKLNPNYPIAHFYYAVYLASLGRQDEAVKEIRRAQELDPLSVPVNATVTYVFYLGRQYDEAIEAGKKTLELDATFPLAHQRLGLAYVGKKMYREAIAEFRQAAKNSSRAPQAMISLGHAYAVSGNKVEAQEVLAELKELSRGHYVSPYGVAMIYLGLGDKEQAFQWLEKANNERNTELTFLKVDPRLDPLRDDPRFQALLKKVGFPR